MRNQTKALLKNTVAAIKFACKKNAGEYLREAAEYHDEVYHLEHKALATLHVSAYNVVTYKKRVAHTKMRREKKEAKKAAKAAEPHGYPPGWLGVGK